MSTLVVVSHPDRKSVTHSAARVVADAITAAGGDVELADLAAEGFDPRFTNADLDLYRGKGEVPDDIVAEQKRIDRADRLILVFPMYWWSMPAMLKGWIDRVFVGGWAYDTASASGVTGMLQRLTIDLLIVAGDDEESFRRHGIPQAIHTQIERGVIEYCGARHGSTTYIYESDSKDRDLISSEIRELGVSMAARIVEASSPIL